MPEKQCAKCGYTCDLADANQYFSRDRKHTDGLCSRCKQCDAAYYATNREEVLARVAERRAAHPEKRRAYRIAHREQIKTYNDAYNAAHREEIRAYSSTYHAIHRDELRVKEAIFRATPSGKLAERARKARRRARKKASGGRVTKEDLALILKAHTDSKGRLRCARCGKVIKGQYHLDHFIPLVKGGTNDPGNFRVMHPKCNLTKKDKLPHEVGILI